MDTFRGVKAQRVAYVNELNCPMELFVPLWQCYCNWKERFITVFERLSAMRSRCRCRDRMPSDSEIKSMQLTVFLIRGNSNISERVFNVD